MPPQSNQVASQKNWINSLFLPLVLMLGVWIQSGCVTVNVNFPETAVQQATDDYVKELYNKAKRKSAPAEAEKKTGSFRFVRSFLSSFSTLMGFEAHATNINFNIRTPAISAIQDQQANRLGTFENYKSKGFVWCEHKNGMISVESTGSLNPTEKAHVKALVEAENRDRQKLYEESLKANGLPQSPAMLKAIQEKFYDSFKSVAGPGTQFENDSGKCGQ